VPSASLLELRDLCVEGGAPLDELRKRPLTNLYEDGRGERDVDVLRRDLLIVDLDPTLLDEALGFAATGDEAGGLEEIDDPDAAVILQKRAIKLHSRHVGWPLMADVDAIEFRFC